MARTSFMQNSFLAGEYSPFSQGQSDEQDYYRGLNLCLNYLPTDEGALTRRPGLRFSGEARANAVKLIPFYTAAGNSYICELTSGVMRFHTIGVVIDDLPRLDVVNFSSATPCVVTTDGAHGWSTGDTVIFNDIGADTAPELFNRQFRITVTATDKFSLAHTGSKGTGSVDGTVLSAAILAGEQVGRITETTIPYTSTQLADVRHTEEADNLYLFHQSHEPNVLDGALLTITEADFLDGPYLDQNATATTLTFSGTTGSGITVTASAVTGINGGSGFQTTDVGRLIRINTGSETEPNWSWLEITARTSTTVVTATIRGDDLASGSANTKWRLGVYSDTTGWPKHGVVHEGRLWLIGDAFVGRVDGSKPFDFFNFAPTAADGTVADDNGVSAVAAGPGRKNFKWLKVADDGLLAGSDSAEWLVHASALNDPITPFTIQIHRQSKYGVADVLPVEAGANTLFVQAVGTQLIEYRKEGGKYDGNDVARRGKHLTAVGIAEMAYSASPSPVIWARRTDQRLIAITYRNDLEGKQRGWHRHNVAWADDPYDATALAEGRHEFANATGPVLSVAAAPFSDREATRNDTVWAAVLRNGQACVEYFTPIFDDTRNPNEAFHVDSGNAYKHEDLGVTWVSLGNDQYRFYGLDRLVGDSVDGTFRGVDLGSGTVVSGGYVDLTVNSELNVVASAYEFASRSSIVEGALTFSSAYVSDRRVTGNSEIGNPCPMSTIIVGEDGNRYYVEGGVGGAGGGASTLYIRDADTGLLADSKAISTMATEATSLGVTPNPNNGAGDGSIAVAIPETPYILVVYGGATGLAVNHTVLYYKMNSSSLLEAVGGLSYSQDGLGVQFSPPEAFGASAVAAGFITWGEPIGDSVPMDSPIAVAWYGESRSSIMVFPSVNEMIGTALNVENATNPWFNRQLDLSAVGMGANILNVGDNPSGAEFVRGFFAPVAGGGAMFCQMFFQSDLAAHAAGTETITNTFLDTHAATYEDGLISAVQVLAFSNTDEEDQLSRYLGAVEIAFHERVLNDDGTVGFPFEDDGQDYDGTAGLSTDNYYCNPTLYPSDPADPTAPWYCFFYRTYRKSGDRDKGGVRILKWDPKALVFTFVDFVKGQIFDLGTDVPSTTNVATGNVQWDRDTGQMTLFLRSIEGGAKGHIITEFGTFDATLETISDVDDGHVDAVVGLNYESRAQLLRPDLNSGAESGPGLGKLRRTDRFNGLFYRTGQINFGTKFDDLKPLVLLPPDTLGRRQLASKVSDIRSLQDSYSYDSMIAFQQDRPEPGGIVSIAGHISTQDV